MPEYDNGTASPDQPLLGSPETQQADTTTDSLESAIDENQPSAEQIAQWKSQADEAVKYKQQYDSLLPEFTRKSQALAQLAGSQTPTAKPADPLSEIAASLVSQGYSVRDAAAVAKSVGGPLFSRLSVLEQQVQQGQSALHNNSIIGDVMQQCWKESPDLFSNPQVAEEVNATLRSIAMNGEPVTKDMALNIAYIAEGRARHGARQQTQAPPTQSTPNFNSQIGPFSSLSNLRPAPSQNTIQPMTPAQSELQSVIDARYKK